MAAGFGRTDFARRPSLLRTESAEGLSRTPTVPETGDHVFTHAIGIADQKRPLTVPLPLKIERSEAGITATFRGKSFSLHPAQKAALENHWVGSYEDAGRRLVIAVHVNQTDGSIRSIHEDNQRWVPERAEGDRFREHDYGVKQTLVR